MNFLNDSGRKLCPFKEKCYRKNPIHFEEMSHPHLEKLMTDPYSEINIPVTLDFECQDRSQIMDQLEILQIVLRKHDKKPTNDSKLHVSAEPSTSQVDELKAKVEKHKQESLARRINKLQVIDDQEEALAEESKISKNKSDDFESSNKKRISNSNLEETSVSKKAKTSTNDSVDNVKNSNQFSSSSSEFYQLNEKRRRAIEKMKHYGVNISLTSPGKFILKYNKSAPYHIFFTRVENNKETYNQQLSVTFPEILDRSLGEIVKSLHINFMVDVGWLCSQYILAAQRADMLILFGERVDEDKLPSNIKTIPIKMPSAYGCHHSKIMILQYKNNGIRVVVSTANLYSDDWENRTQGLWISPHLPQLSDDVNPKQGESSTNFKRDFERYLLKYKIPELSEWIQLVRRSDFSPVNVFFLSSVPGSHKGIETEYWGHKRLASILLKNAVLPADAPQWPIIAQCSSIGSLGPNYESWISRDIIDSMSKEKNTGLKSHPSFKFIYPTINNYEESFDCRKGSCCLPYSIKVHSKQEWLKSYLYKWKASKMGRDKAMPHIKCYTRISPDMKQIPWFVLTSANLSKSAWGTMRNTNYIMSYEAGVVFIPKIINGTTVFSLQEEKDSSVPAFPLVYDIPLTRYEQSDEPFVMEFIKT